MSLFGRLLVHTSNYSIGSLLVTLAGFISFPIFTRIFSVEEYGLMSLISSTLVLMTVLGKLGMQHSIIRFYAEVKAGSRECTEEQFFSTVAFGMAGSGLLVAVLWAVISQLIPAQWWSNPSVRGLMLLTAVLVIVRTLDSAFVNLLKAQQRSGWFSVYSVVRRYSVLFAVIITVLYLVPGLNGFYWGTVVAEIIATGVLGGLLLHHHGISHHKFSLPLLKAMMVFGLPMIAYEFAGVVLSLGDRYVIQSLIGAEPLGSYSAAYNMCEYAQSILVMSFGQAVGPMYMRLWEEKGVAATRAFIERALHFYILGATALVALVSLVGGDVLTTLASQRYGAGAAVIPWVIAGMAIDGCLPILGAGIFIKKQTKALMLLVVASAALNMALNYALVPKMGIVGAGIATLVSYLLLSIGASIVGRRTIAIGLPIGTLAKFIAIGFATYFVADVAEFEGRFAALVAKGALGLTVFVALTWTLDAEARQQLAALVGRFKSRTAG